MSSTTDDSNMIVNMQSMLEHNEDIVAAVVENIQIHRLDDCIRHYNILHNNLMTICTELDKYPPGVADLYSDIIMK